MRSRTSVALAPAAFEAKPTLVGPASGGGDHWANVAIAKDGIASLGVVQGIWSAHGFQPNAARQLLGDPRAAADICNIVDLYLHPPADAVVLSVDEKGQIPVTARTRIECAQAENYPLDSGPHDPGWHPTTTLFCALDVHSGRVIGRCMQRQRVREFIRFLNAIERETRNRGRFPGGVVALRAAP